MERTSYLQHNLHIVLVSFGFLMSREPRAIVQETATDPRLEILRTFQHLSRTYLATDLFGINWKGWRDLTLNHFDWHNRTGLDPRVIVCALKQTAGL